MKNEVRIMEALNICSEEFISCMSEDGQLCPYFGEADCRGRLIDGARELVDRLKMDLRGAPP